MKNNKFKLTLGLGLVLLAFGFLFQEIREPSIVEVDTHHSNIDISDFDFTIVPQGGTVNFLVTARMYSPECIVGSVVNFRKYSFDIDMGGIGNVTWSGVDALGAVTTQSGGTVTMVNPLDADSDLGVTGDAMLAACNDAASADGSGNPCTTCTPDSEGYCTLCVIGNGSVQADWTFMVSFDIPANQAIGAYPITGIETFDSYFGDFLIMADDGVTYPAAGQLPRAIDVVAALPINLVSFDVKKEGKMVHISWQTASEINNDYFEVQRSKDGNNFETIANIPGNGTTSEIMTYSYMDEKPRNGVNYYRLHQVDFDGQSETFEIRSIRFDRSKGDVLISPNPFNDNIVLDAADSKIINIKIYDMLGKQLDIISNPAQTTINLSNMPNGSLMVVVTTEEGQSVHKIIKE